MKKSFSVILKTFGVLSLTISALFGWAMLNSFVERINNGPGLMFADVELLLILFVFFLLFGVFLFLIEKKLHR